MDHEFVWSLPSFTLVAGGSHSRRRRRIMLDEHLEFVTVPSNAGDERHVILFTDEPLADEFLESVVPNKGYRKFTISTLEEMVNLLRHTKRLHEHVIIDPNPTARGSLSMPIDQLIQSFEVFLEDAPNDGIR
jgi:hypothetical protein